MAKYLLKSALSEVPIPERRDEQTCTQETVLRSLAAAAGLNTAAIRDQDGRPASCKEWASPRRADGWL